MKSADLPLIDIIQINENIGHPPLFFQRFSDRIASNQNHGSRTVRRVFG